MAHPKGEIAKPTVLTDKAKATIVQLLAEGNYLTTACAVAGLSRDTFDHWRRRYEAGEEKAMKHADFFTACERAGSVAESNALRTLRQGGLGWQASAWYLERKFPRKWGRKVVLAIPPTTDLDKLSDEQLQAIIDKH